MLQNVKHKNLSLETLKNFEKKPSVKTKFYGKVLFKGALIKK